MTVRTNSVQTCDRCLKPFNEKHLKAGQEVPLFKQKGLVVIETSGTNMEEEPKTKVLFAFDDMCPSCQTAVVPLLDKLRLNTPSKKKRKPRAPKTEKSNGKAEIEAKTPEYTEPETAEATPPEKGGQADAATKSGAEADVPASDGGDAGADGKATSSGESSDGVIVDPETGDRYDAKTGEVLPAKPAEDAEDAGGAEAHPF